MSKCNHPVEGTLSVLIPGRGSTKTTANLFGKTDFQFSVFIVWGGECISKANPHSHICTVRSSERNGTVVSTLENVLLLKP